MKVSKFKAVASVCPVKYLAMYVFGMLSLCRIVISDLVVANLFMHLFSGMILLYLAAPFYTEGVYAWDKPYMDK